MKLTPLDRAVLSALDYTPLRAHLIARMAKIHTMSPSETAARHCIKLTKAGLAEKIGTRMFPSWRITEAGRALLSTGADNG